MKINIDNSDKDVSDFLLGLGFSEKDIADGVLYDSPDIESKHVDCYSLELISQLNLDVPRMAAHYAKYKVPGYCSNIVLAGGGDLLTAADLKILRDRTGGKDISYLLRDWEHDETRIAPTYNLPMLAHELDVKTCEVNASLNVPKIIPSEVPIPSLRDYPNLSLSADLVDEKARDFGKAVYKLILKDDPVRKDGFCSAVAISAKGDFLTTRHCLAKENDELRPAILVGGIEHPIKSNIIYEDSDYDLVYFRIPGLATPDFLEPATTPTEVGSSVIGIGYPTTQQDNEERFSFGQVMEPESLLGTTLKKLNTYLFSNVTASGGNSGGALVDAKSKKLLGIVTNIGLFMDNVNFPLGVYAVPVSAVMSKILKPDGLPPSKNYEL